MQEHAETAADRVREFLAARPLPDGAVVSRVLTPTKGIDLTFEDLQTLVQQADALRSVEATLHMVIEANGHSGDCTQACFEARA